MSNRSIVFAQSAPWLWPVRAIHDRSFLLFVIARFSPAQPTGKQRRQPLTGRKASVRLPWATKMAVANLLGVMPAVGEEGSSNAGMPTGLVCWSLGSISC
jgi:hypothetical protein